MLDPQHREPQIAASLVNGLRRTLIEDGTWEQVEADVLAREPMLADWLADADEDDWISLEGHIRYMQALLDVLGRERLRERGAARLRHDMDIGPLAGLLRSWLREYGKDPAILFRIGPHAWRAVTRRAGQMVLVSSTPGRIRFRIEGAPPLLRELRGWHVLLEGFAEELLRVTGRQGSASVGPDPDGASLSFEVAWSEEVSEG